MQVRVYRNSIRNEWAVVKVGGGNRKVSFYAPELRLTDATFHNGPKGRTHVCKSGHKNRHNYIEGRLDSFSSVRRGVGPAAHDVHLQENAPETRFTVMPHPWLPPYLCPRVEKAGAVEFTSYGSIFMTCDPAFCVEVRS